MHHTFRNALIFAVALVIGGAAPTLAQGLPGGATSLNETHGDWRVICTAPENAARCAVSQVQVNGENRQRVLGIELIAAGEGNAAKGTLVLPFGLKLAAGVVLKVDENEPLAEPGFSTCLPAGCLVPLSFDAAALTALREGSTLEVTATANDNGQEVKLSVSLTGFSSALARAAELSGS